MSRRINTWLSTFVGLMAGLALSLSGSLLLPTSVSAQSAQDCDDNAVIRCGASDLNNLKQKYRENQQGNVQALYTAFGIANEDAMSGMVEGQVSGSNEVFVGDQKVATNAFTAGRQNISNERGSSLDMGGGQFWYRHPSVSFANPAGRLRALVKMEGGSFKFAVIMACGNPVLATPVPPTTTPAPRQKSFEVTKQVRVSGQSQWTSHATMRTDDSLEYRIVIKNTGEADLADVTVRDNLPGGMRLDAGTLTSGISSEALFGAGFNLGNIMRGQQREIIFRLSSSRQGGTSSACIASEFRNVAFARAKDLPEKRAEASANVICQQAVPAVSTPQPPVLPPIVLAAATTPVPAQAPRLPDTGPGEVLGMFAAVSVSGFAAHHFIWNRRYKF